MINDKMINETENNESKVMSALNNFTGTENYYKAGLFGNLKVTDGIHFLRNELNCYWLIDIVCSVQHLQKIKDNYDFIVWVIDVSEDRSCCVSAYRDSPFNKTNLLYSQKLEYTDFKFKHFEFYQCQDVILLKTEY